MTDIDAPAHRAPAHCPTCGTGTGQGWDFCRGCGHALSAPARGAPRDMSGEPTAADRPTTPEGDQAGAEGDVPAPARRPRRVSPRRLLTSVGVAVGVALIAGGAVGNQHVRDDLDATRSTLAATRRTLDATSADLGTRTGERDAAKAALARAEGDLAATRSDLANAQTRVSGQATQIANLRTCLDGVLEATSDLASEYYASAIADLNRVEIPCRNARSSVG